MNQISIAQSDKKKKKGNESEERKEGESPYIDH
jgi:hypothetical protein